MQILYGLRHCWLSVRPNKKHFSIKNNNVYIKQLNTTTSTITTTTTTTTTPVDPIAKFFNK